MNCTTSVELLPDGNYRHTCKACGKVAIVPTERYVSACTDPNAGMECVHLGEEVDRVSCPTCNGNVQLKVFACAKHGHCTIDRRVSWLACCNTPACPDKTFRPRTASG